MRKAERLKQRKTAGFTMVELIVAMLLGALVLGATYQVLITNQRVYSAQREQVFDHGTVRAGLDVLSGELREVSPSGGDIVDMAETWIEVRTMRNLGFVCNVDTDNTPPRFTLRRPTGVWSAGDSILIFADNNPNNPNDDVWLEGEITNVPTGAPCPGDDGDTERRRVDVIGLGQIFPLDVDGHMVHRGAPARTFEVHRYGVMDYEGRPFLGRRSGGALEEWIPLVGPLAEEGGLRLEYFDEDGNATTDPAQVRRIDVSLRTLSDARTARGERVEQSVATSIYTRN